MREHDPVGSAAEEAAKLIGAVSDWARDLGHGLAGGLDDHLATGAPECTYCPICRTVHVTREVIREASPEVKVHLAEAAAALMQAAAGVVAAAGAAGWGSSTRRSGSVQHIDLDDDQAQQWPEEPEGT